MSIKTVITDGGMELLRAAPAHTLIYARAVCGSGFVEGTQLAELTDVVDIKPTETAATLRFQLDNSKAPKEFQLYQIGVFAKLMDGDSELISERLFHIMQYDVPDIVRAVPYISEYVVTTLIGQAEPVEGAIDLAAYVSIRQLQDTITNLNVTGIKQTIKTGEDGEPFSLNAFLPLQNDRFNTMSAEEIGYRFPNEDTTESS